MSFLPEKTEQKTKFVNNYLTLREGFPVLVQILGDATQKFQHWMKTPDKPKGFPVPCLGYRDCPICLRNRSLGENYREHPDFISVAKRYLVNVVDLTPCKRSGDEVYLGVPDNTGKLVFPSQDSKGNSLESVPVTPVNEVKILERGPDLFEKKLRPLAVAGAVTDADDNPLDITQFPIQLTLTGSGRTADVGVVPKVGNRSTINPNDYQDKLIDLTAGLRYTADEIEEMMHGTSFADIMAARKAMGELTKKDSLVNASGIEY